MSIMSMIMGMSFNLNINVVVYVYGISTRKFYVLKLKYLKLNLIFFVFLHIFGGYSPV